MLAYVHSSIPTIRLENIEASDKEVLWLLHTPPRISRPFSCIITDALYFPPGKTCTEERELIDHITERLDNLLIERPSAGIIITGDFNHLNPRQLCQRFSLRKLVKMPTRGQNILDQFLSNMGELYCEAQLLPPLGRSDHQCILFSPLNQQRHGKAISRSERTFKPDSLRSLGLKLYVESWSAVYEASDVEEKVEAFNSIIINSPDMCTPLRPVRLHPSDKEWMKPHIKDQIRARQKAWVKGEKEKYHQKRETVAALISSAKRNFYERKASNLRYTNPSKWFKDICSLCGANKAELQKTADLLLDAFVAPWKDQEPTALSVSEVADDLDDRPPPVPNIGQVKAILKHVNPRKATGVDGVPVWLLKRFHEEPAPAVHDIICASIVQSKYPTSYKHALVSPVPKVDNPTDINRFQFCHKSPRYWRGSSLS